MASESGHDIHQDQPELVIEAMRQVVEGVRNPDTWYDLTSCCDGITGPRSLRARKPRAWERAVGPRHLVASPAPVANGGQSTREW